MTFSLKIIFSLTVVFHLNTTFGQLLGKDTAFFYHISYIGGPPSSENHTLCWYTWTEVPNTHFIIEHFCWNRWVKRGKVTGKGRPGTGEYKGKEAGKFQYQFGITRHSGENKFRVLLMNDSNVCLAVSKELNGMQARAPKANYSIEKKGKEIQFSYTTYYEMYNAKDSLVKYGNGKTLNYFDLPEGIYTLYYDSSKTTLKIK